MSLLEQVTQLVPDIAAAAERTERERAVPDELVARLAATGVFRVAAPHAAGGLQADPLTMFEAFERLGQADGSTGWCAMIAGATSIAFVYLDPAVAKEMLDDPGCLVAGVAAPAGRAVAVPGGYRVTGRWAFASGVRHATWLVGGCLVGEEGSPPQQLLVVLPRDEVTVHDTWDTVGLRGTGSHDFSAQEVYVPSPRTFTFARPPGTPHGGFPALSFLALGIGAVALGIAQAAIDEYTRLAAGKLNPMTGQPLSTRPAAQTALAEATAQHAAGRAFLSGEISRCWQAACAGDPVPPAQVARLRLAITHATNAAAGAVGRLYRAAGASSVHLTSPLQRQFRDVHVVTQHALVNADTLELTGAVLLGAPVSTLRL